MLLTMIVARVVSGQDLIDRRDQARGAFLATPEGIYTQYCAHCHGDDATGDGRLWTSELPLPPADLTQLDVDREYLIDAIREGSAVHGKSNLCPPWGNTISSTNIQRLAQHLVSLGGEDVPVSASSEPEAPPAPRRSGSPWFLTAVLLTELGVLWRMLRPGKGGSSVVSQDSSVG